MTPQEIYLDNNATTRPLPEVVEAVTEAMGEHFGNPSSAHSVGERARILIATARDQVAQLLGAEPEQVFFNSGATEGNNTVLAMLLNEPSEKRHLVTTSIEHSSVLKAADWLEGRGVRVTRIAPTAQGVVTPESLEEALTAPAGLVSVQWVNSETGVIQPIDQIARLCAARGIPLHVDGSQAVGKISMGVTGAGIDFLTLTGHKLHAPQGVGVLCARNSRALSPLIHGGSQEGGLRAGTENIPGIAGLGVAAQLRRQRLTGVQQELTRLRDTLETNVLESIPGTKINGGPANRVCNTTNLRFEGVDGEALVARLDQAGIQCSQSSACTNQRPEPSYVLREMGLSEEEAYSSIRFSVSELNSHEEVVATVKELSRLCGTLRAFRAGLAS